MTRINKGRRLQVTFDLDLPETATEEEIQEWLDMELGASGSLSGENPLIHSGVEADRVDVTITGVYRKYDITDIRQDPETNGVRYRVKTTTHSDERTPEEAETWKSRRDAGREVIDPLMKATK